MKSLLRHACAILIIMPCYFFAMDFDKEDGIPLSAIYQKTTIKTTEPKSSEQQFADFEQKIKIEYGASSLLTKALYSCYFEKAQREAPAIIASDEMVKKFSLIENSFYAKAIENLITQAQSHYENVTCNTLSTINNPHVSQPSSFLNKLPFYVRAHIMRCAYESLDMGYAVVNLPKNYTRSSIRNKTHIAA